MSSQLDSKMYPTNKVCDPQQELARELKRAAVSWFEPAGLQVSTLSSAGSLWLLVSPVALAEFFLLFKSKFSGDISPKL